MKIKYPNNLGAVHTRKANSQTRDDVDSLIILVGSDVCFLD